MIITLNLLGELMVNSWLISFVKVKILQFMLMIHLAMSNTSFFYVISLCLHTKKNFKMGGAMIGRLEISCFRVIGTIGGGRTLELLCC